MISRTAEQCFWLCRHIERIDHVARFMSVNQSYILDADLDNYDKWFPFVIVLGEESRFLETYGDSDPTDDLVIQSYLIWSEKNPFSIYTSCMSARENARVIRDVVSLELWECLNSFWLWLNTEKAKRLCAKDRLAFYLAIKKNVENFYGIFFNTMLQQEAYHFMRLGMMVERSNQVARVLDVKSHRIGAHQISRHETVIETLHWLSLLKFFSASESFLKKNNAVIDRKNVGSFLIFEKDFPRTILYCLNSARDSLSYLQTSAFNKESICLIKKTDQLINQIESTTIDQVLSGSLNCFLTDAIDKIADICQEIDAVYFNPDLSFTDILEQQPL